MLVVGYESVSESMERAWQWKVKLKNIKLGRQSLLPVQRAILLFFNHPEIPTNKPPQ